VDASFCMRCLQPLGDLDGYAQRSDNIERPLIDLSGQGLALDKFHYDAGRFPILNQFIYCGNLRTIQIGGGARFFPKLSARNLILERRGQNKLKCDGATELKVLGPINLSQPSSPKVLGNAIMTNHLACKHGNAPENLAWGIAG